MPWNDPIVPAQPVFRSSFSSWEDEFNGMGKRPVVFDIVATDGETSLLPNDLKLVLHVNPRSMAFSYSKVIERIQTKGGWVEQHWGEGPATMTLEGATGGFMRLFSGLSHTTGPTPGGGQDSGAEGLAGRRQTISYDKYLDFLALFHNNGNVYDARGTLAFQGMIKVTFDGGTHFGWFNSFSVTESAEKPYQFELSTEFQIHREFYDLRTIDAGDSYGGGTRFDRGGAYSGEWPEYGQAVPPPPPYAEPAIGPTVPLPKITASGGSTGKKRKGKKRSKPKPRVYTEQEVQNMEDYNAANSEDLGYSTTHIPTQSSVVPDEPLSTEVEE